MKYVAIINGEQFEVEIDRDGRLYVNGEQREIDFLALGESLYSVIMDNRSLQLVIEEDAGKYSIMMGGRLYEGQVLDERAMLLAMRKGGLGSGSGELHSPMPGLIVKITVEDGQHVTQGETVIILESMKMQNELKAPIDGVIQSIQVRDGQTVDKGALLLVITPSGE